MHTSSRYRRKDKSIVITGLGTDIVEIDRIRKASLKPRFLEKVFTDSERELFLKYNNSIQMIAGNFASKEAVSKALGTGIGKIGWKEIEVLRDLQGKPVVTLRGNALQFLENLPGNKIWVSISHIRSLAVAQAIIECRREF